MKLVKLFLFLLIGISFLGCSGDDLTPEEQFDEDVLIIEQYLTDNNLAAEVTNSGLRYIISSPGNGERAGASSTVAVYYTGSLINGEIFDSVQRGVRAPIEFNTNGVIPGFSEGLKLIGEGGAIKIIMPSAIGYGKNPPARSIISEDEVLIFDIEMVEIK